jgi:hypothetical protein
MNPNLFSCTTFLYLSPRPFWTPRLLRAEPLLELKMRKTPPRAAHGQLTSKPRHRLAAKLAGMTAPANARLAMRLPFQPLRFWPNHKTANVNTSQKLSIRAAVPAKGIALTYDERGTAIRAKAVA